jgi:hypothetical protein
MTMDEKKEKVLHTRIPESLDEEIREHAANLGISVSNLVRNVLQNTVGLVGDIVADTAHLARTARGHRDDPAEVLATESAPPAQRPGAVSVIGWQDVTLNINALCEACNGILPKGSRAGIAITDGPGPRTFRCPSCLEEIQNVTPPTASVPAPRPSAPAADEPPAPRDDAPPAAAGPTEAGKPEGPRRPE